MTDLASTSTPTDCWTELLRAITDRWPPQRWANLGVVVGVSGGADSVALLHALSELRQQQGNARGFLVVAHYHHGVRGTEADEDAGFVQSLAIELGLRHEQGNARDSSTDEASMREARASFLRQTAQTHGARYVAVAHTADDNVETTLHHLMRGTGPKGLAGIPPCRSVGEDPIGQDLVLIRPLLKVRRQTIRDGLQARHHDWREDSSNTNTSYRRNWIRHELLPLMLSKHPHAIDAITRAIESQNDWKRVIDGLASEWIDKHVDSSGPVTVQFNDADPAIMIAALQTLWSRQNWPQGEMTQEHWLRLTNVIKARKPARFTLPGNIDALVESHLNLKRTTDS